VAILENVFVYFDSDVCLLGQILSTRMSWGIELYKKLKRYHMNRLKKLSIWPP
jgi:hypothetical protein